MRDPTKPDVEERYLHAIESKDLMVAPYRVDVDYLIAIGWIPETLGSRLYRLRREWDNVRADLRRAQDAAAQGFRTASKLERYANVAATDQLDAERKREAARIIRQQTEEAALTERALVLAHLKSLSKTVDALHAFALAFGVRKRFFNVDAVRAVSSRSLQLWLDPLCPHCDGLGFTGGFNEPKILCQECINTGKRINGNPGFRLAKSDEGHEFGRALLVEMDRKAEHVSKAMESFLSFARVDVASWGEAESLALRKRLAELRSTEAEKD